MNNTALKLMSCFFLFLSIFVIVFSVYGQSQPVLNLGIRHRFTFVTMRYLRHNNPDLVGTTVPDPKVFFESVRFNRHGHNTTEGYLGYEGDEFDIAVHVSNDINQPDFNLSIAPEHTPIANVRWKIDHNESGGGFPVDSVVRALGQLEIDPSLAVVSTDLSYCNITDVERGQKLNFSQTASIDLLKSNADVSNCAFDIWDIKLTQTIPQNTPEGSYTLPMVLTVTN